MQTLRQFSTVDSLTPSEFYGSKIPFTKDKYIGFPIIRPPVTLGVPVPLIGE
jgi:hypothetical protein